MAVLKVKRNGVWEKLGGVSKLDGGNADTLDGKHASDFANKNEFDLLSEKVGSDPVNEQITSAIDNLYDYGPTDLTAGVSALQTGKLYFVYE